MRCTRYLLLPMLLAAMLLLVPAAPASAQLRLPYSVAKTRTKQTANGICGSITGCYRTRVPSCVRRSSVRVDCLALFDFDDGITCGMQVINRLDSSGILHQSHKAIRCG